MSRFFAWLLVLPACQGGLRRNPTCTADLNQLNQVVGDDMMPVTTWELKKLAGGSACWATSGWSADSKAAMDDKCRANNGKRCEISGRLSFKTTTSTLVLSTDPYAMTCRPNSCQAQSNWRAALQFVGDDQGANGFFWKAKDDHISNGCALNPSLCTFEFNVCDETISFPYDPLTVTSDPDVASAAASMIDAITTDGSTTDGTTTDGSTTDGTTTDGTTTDGTTTDGSTTDGSTTDGSTTDGSDPNGSTTDATGTDGSTTDGSTTNGSNAGTDGNTTDDTGSNINGNEDKDQSSTKSDDDGLSDTTIALIIAGGVAAVIAIGIAAKNWNKGKSEEPTFEEYE